MTTPERNPEDFCGYCDCHIDLHDEEGCFCEDSEGHPGTLETIENEDYCKDYCNCWITRTEIVSNRNMALD